MKNSIRGFSAAELRYCQAHQDDPMCREIVKGWQGYRQHPSEATFEALADGLEKFRAQHGEPMHKMTGFFFYMGVPMRRGKPPLTPIIAYLDNGMPMLMGGDELAVFNCQPFVTRLRKGGYSMTLHRYELADDNEIQHGRPPMDDLPQDLYAIVNIKPDGHENIMLVQVGRGNDPRPLIADDPVGAREIIELADAIFNEGRRMEFRRYSLTSPTPVDEAALLADL